MAQLTTEFVDVNKVPAQLLKYGQLDDSDDNGDQTLMLIIPGNPGVPMFYADFMQELYALGQQKHPVWCLGHSGHVQPPGQALTPGDVFATDEKKYGLEAQISHKVEFVRRHIPPDVKLILIGHSIGCYMILNMLDHLEPSQVVRCFMLFPTIERMAVSPNGQVMTPGLRYLRWLLVMACIFLVMIPQKYRSKLISWWFRNVECPPCSKPAVLSTATPWTANFSSYLGKVEMGKVVDLQRDLVKKHSSKLSLYYGACDSWTPVQYYHDLVKEFPDIDTKLCHLNLKHAFVLVESEGKQMAKFMWLWFLSLHPSDPSSDDSAQDK